ncbi:MAG TPA: TetR/AcrR family transcriptional regulator C-terminal domain-containing protein [Candidatus Limnocylindrales bacterium]
MASRYELIVAEIRRRITDGELQPGVRVPSARQITAQWGVAIATATKVLAALQQEGLVRSVPGVGTVVTVTAAGAAPPPPAAATGGGALNREAIVRAAIELADAEGMAALSMRRIATDLGVATMSLYRYVSGKDELVLLMMDAACGEIRLPSKRPRGWRAQLELAARALWALFRSHPWLGPSLSVTRPQLVPNGLRYAEWVLQAISGHKLDAPAMMQIHVTLFSFIRGIAFNLEPEALAERDTGLTAEEWMDLQEAAFHEVAGASAFVAFVDQVAESEFEFDLDLLFEFGLARLLDGLATIMNR